jgi:thioesterase domain-containing protein/acyl carrier protein
VLQITPSYLSLLVEDRGSWRFLAGLRRLLVGGERLSEELVAGLKVRTGAEVYNMYGPTETTVWSAVKRIGIKGGVTIGEPIANTRIYIVDGEGRVCPIGVWGELCIGGEGVSRGYVNRVELTAEKFVGDWIREEEGGRVYRTGDVGRWRADGELEVSGRRDEQVKIRGYRIELGEIGEVLEGSGMVSRGVVAVKGEGMSRRLVGYVVKKAGYGLEEVREYLGGRLPGYMVPGQWVELETVPLTANGKVDRKRLPDPEEVEGRGVSYVGPRSEVEAELVRIWSELLGVERIGVEDNFFELGGHSLLAIRLISAMAKALAMEITIADMFNYPTVASLASKLGAKRGKTTGLSAESESVGNSHVILLSKNKNNLPVFAIPAIGGRSESFQNLASALEGNYTLYGIHMLGTEKDETPLTGIEAIAEQNIRWIRQVQPKGPYRFIGNSFGGSVIFEMARQAEKSGMTVASVYMLDGYAGLKGAASLKIDDVELAMNYAFEFFGRFTTTENLYSVWEKELRSELTSLPSEKMAAHIAGFVKARVNESWDTIDLLSRLINVSVHNAKLDYRPIGRLDAKISVFVSEQSLQKYNDEALGWTEHAPIVTAHKICRAHIEMLDEESSSTIAELIRPDAEI